MSPKPSKFAREIVKAMKKAVVAKKVEVPAAKPAQGYRHMMDDAIEKGAHGASDIFRDVPR